MQSTDTKKNDKQAQAHFMLLLLVSLACVVVKRIDGSNGSPAKELKIGAKALLRGPTSALRILNAVAK